MNGFRCNLTIKVLMKYLKAKDSRLVLNAMKVT